MRWWWRLAGAMLALIVVGAADVRAQTLPLPTLPAETPPSPAPGQNPAAGPPVNPLLAPQRRWEYATGVGVRWDRNISFLVPDGPSALALVPHASVARVFAGPRGQLKLGAGGRWIGYAEQENQRRGYVDFVLDGQHRASPHTTWRALASYSLGHSDTSQPLLDQGVLLPLVKMRTFTGALGVSRQVGTRTSLLLDGRYYRAEFDSPALFDGDSVRGTFALEHRLSARNTTAIVYALEDVLADPVGKAYLTHFGSLQWTRVLSPRTAVLVEGGASYTPDAARARLEQERTFFGGATLVRQVGRSSVTAFVRREVTPAFGSGASRLDLRGGLSVAVPMGRDWELRSSAAHIASSSPTDALRAYPSGDDATLRLIRRVGARIEISADGWYRRRAATLVLPSTESFQAGLFIALTSPRPRGADGLNDR